MWVVCVILLILFAVFCLFMAVKTITQNNDKLKNENISDNSPIIFAGKNIVIKGTLGLYPNRAKLIPILEGYGATIQSRVSPTTNMLIYGSFPGKEDIAKAFASNHIEVLSEIDFYEYMISLNHPEFIPLKPYFEATQEDMEDMDDLETKIPNYTSFFKNVSFENKHVVLSGLFRSATIAEDLNKYGAVIGDNLSHETDILICGDNPDWTLLQYAEELQKAKENFVVIEESQFRNCQKTLALKEMGIMRTSSYSCNGVRRIIANEQIRAKELEKDDNEGAIAIYLNIIKMNYYFSFTFERLAINYRKKKLWSKEKDILDTWQSYAEKDSDSKSLAKLKTRYEYLAKKTL